MRKNKLLFLFFLLGLSVLSVAKEFIVPAQTVYNEEIIGLKQRIVVQGEANKDIVLLGGELILSGQARRDVVLIGADCTLKPGSGSSSPVSQRLMANWAEPVVAVMSSAPVSASPSTADVWIVVGNQPTWVCGMSARSRICCS